MVRDLCWGKLSKIHTEEKINLIFEVLIPVTYLKAVNRNKKKIRKIDIYRKEIENLLANSNLEDYKRQELAHRLRYFDSGEQEW